MLYLLLGFAVMYVIVIGRHKQEHFNGILDIPLSRPNITPQRNYNEFSVIKDYVDDIVKPIDVSGNFDHVAPNEFLEDRSLMIGHAVQGVQAAFDLTTPQTVSLVNSLVSERVR